MGLGIPMLAGALLESRICYRKRDGGWRCRRRGSSAAIGNGSPQKPDQTAKPERC